MITLCPFYDDDYAVILLCRTLVFLRSRRPVIVSQLEHIVYDGDDGGNDDDADEIVMTIMLCQTLVFLNAGR